MRSLLLAFTVCIFHFNVTAQFSFSDSAVRSRICRDIFVLASDSFEGREAGTEGERKAYTYIISRLKEAEVSPLVANNYLQPFTTGHIKFTKPARLIAAGRSFSWRNDFGLCAYSANDSVTALWADAGFGLVIPDAVTGSYKDIPGISGKIVLINLDSPSKLSKDTSLEAELTPAVRIANAVIKGAAGVILYNGQGDYKSRLFDFSKSDSVTVPVIYASSKVIDFIKSHPSGPLTMAVHLERVSKTYNNVTAYIDNGATRTIILGGHYDHLGKSEKPADKGAYCVGADDNASGTAGILELARFYTTHKDPRNNYLIILFSAEEKGLFGSEYFVKQMRPAMIDSINFMLNFDMIGRLGCEGLLVTAEASGSSPFWPRLYREVKHPGFRLKKVASSLPFSDQDAFYNKGIPVLYLTTGLHQQYHTPADRPSTINYTGMAGLLGYSERLISKAGSGEKVPYRKVPEINLYLEIAGFLLGYFGDLLSF
ncbi:MAG: M28 family metallopeptidase [Bacteroidetes bacterium]|nr:M28 family metallopeptidase [Bacteroidota bacterium]